MFIFPAIRFTIHFVIIFFLMLIPIGGGQNLFDFLDNATIGARETVIDKSTEVASAAWKGTKDFGSKLFTNSSPSKIKKDRIKVQQSKVRRKQRAQSTNSPLLKIIKREELEHIGEDDMRQLDEFLAD